MVDTWRDFWNRENRIDVSSRHTRAHYRVLGKEVLSLLPARRPLTLLDWGCGQALATPTLVQAGIEVFLFDPIPRFMSALKLFQGMRGVRILTELDVDMLPEKSVDAVLIYSVFQYLTKEEAERIISHISVILRPHGMVIIGDLIAPNHSILRDIADLVVAGMRHGFLFDVFVGLAMTFFSEYRMVRNTNGFTRYEKEEIIDLLAQHGFITKILEKNIGLSTGRTTAVAHRAA